MSDISKLVRLLNGVSRQVDISSNTLVMDNLKAKLGGANYFTFSGSLTAARTITMPDADVNLGYIANLVSLSGVAGGSTNLGSFTGVTIPDNQTIKQALQALETAVEAGSGTTFADDVFRIQDDGDATKQIAFQASGIATATTRTITMPNADVDLGNLAERDLSNLLPTAINENLVFDKTSPVVQSKNDAGNTEMLIVQSGDSSAGDSGILALVSGTSTASSGVVILSSGAVSGSGASGTVLLQSGGNTGTGASGSLQVGSGSVSGAATSGTVSLGSGTAASDPAGQSGAVDISSGNAAAGTGNMLVTTGSVSGASAASGNATFRSGDANVSGGASGAAEVLSGNADVGGATGNVAMYSGSQSGGGSGTSGNAGILTGSADADTGLISLLTGASDNGNSGDISIATGSTAGLASGNITLSTSASFGTTRGSITLDGSQVNVSSKKIINLADPTAAQDAATKQYVDISLQGVKPKQAARAATTADITLSGAQTIDGVSVVAGNRVLVKDQTLSENNGIYVAAAGAWSRSADFDSLSPVDEVNGAWVGIQEGTANGGKVFIQYSLVSTLGTDPVLFTYFSDLSSLIGGDMITVTGSTVSVDLAAVSGLESTNPGNSAGQLRVNLEGTNPSLRITGSNKLAAKLDAAGTITSGASGLKVGVDNTTVEISSNALRVKDGAIDQNKLSANAFDQTTIVGGDGDVVSVQASPLVFKFMTAGEAFAADTSFLVRWAVNGETTEAVYKADKDASVSDKFYAIGMAYSSTAVSASGSIKVTILGNHEFGGSDPVFVAADVGKPVFLTSSGAFSVTAPSAANEAVVRAGILENTNRMWVNPAVVGVN